MTDAETVIAGEEPEPASQAAQDVTPGYWSSVWAIVWKDFTVESHTRQLVGVMLVFSLTTVVVFNFALYGELSAAREVASGFLWITILLAGTLGLNRSLSTEQENRSIEAVLIAPIDRSAIYVGKVLSVTAFTLLVELLLVPVFIAVFNKPFWRLPVLAILFLGTVGYIAAGVLVTSMSIQTKAREVLLPVLLLPLTLPSVLAASQVTAAYLLPEPPPWSEIQFAVALVVAFDILMLTAGFLTYHFVVED
jgi:heme exporter protein B